MPMLRISTQDDYSEIFETDRFEDGVGHLANYHRDGEKVFVALDLDNTVLSYRHTLGTDQWFDFDFNVFMQEGMSAAQAKEKILPQYLKIIKKTNLDDVYVVEENTPTFIRKMQLQGIDVIALTSRGLYLLPETLEQLQRFQIDFNIGSYKNRAQPLEPYGEGMFSNGMILCAGGHKGEALLQCLDPKNMPNRIIMWDDKLSNLQKVSASLAQYNSERAQQDIDYTPIKFTGIRYSRLDDLIQSVDPKVIDLQKRYFDRILSDEDARAIAKANEKKTRPDYIDIEYDHLSDNVVLSVHKYRLYKSLLSLKPDVEKARRVGEVKTFNGKEKLAWQYGFSKDEFTPFFHLLSRHGLIEPSCYNQLRPYFPDDSGYDAEDEFEPLSKVHSKTLVFSSLASIAAQTSSDDRGLNKERLEPGKKRKRTLSSYLSC